MHSSTPAADARLHLVAAKRAAIYGVLCRAASSGHLMSDAVVVVADTTDVLGRKIARAAAGLPGAISAGETHSVAELDEDSTAVIAVTVVAAKSLLARSYESVADGLDRQPTGGCARVLVIAQGAPMLVHTDVRPIAPIAQG